MDTMLWILSFALAGVYLISGGSKLLSRRQRLVAAGMGWVEDAPMSRVRLIGALEVAGAIGVILPWATGIDPFLTPLAAAGLAAVQVGAIWTHVTRHETDRLWFQRDPVRHGSCGGYRAAVLESGRSHDALP